FSFTANTSSFGVDVVAPNCFQCHGGYVDNTFILGLGNTFADFTMDQSFATPFLDQAIQTTFGPASPTWKSYEPFSKSVKATGSHLVTQTVGTNPADKLALVLGAHRNGVDLTWQNAPSYDIPTPVYA